MFVLNICIMIYKLTDQEGPNCTQCHMLPSNKIRVPIFLAKDKMKSFCFLFFKKKKYFVIKILLEKQDSYFKTNRIGSKR